MSLISHIHSAAAEFLKIRLAEKGLPDLVSSHGFILFQLSRQEKITMSDLAARINRDKSTTTVLVRKLRQAGFVKSELSDKDSRIKFITLTDEGRKYTRITAQLSDDLISTFYNGFNNDEKMQVFTLLNRIFSNFQHA